MLTLTLAGLMLAAIIVVWLNRPEPPAIYDWAEDVDWRDDAPRWLR